MSQLCPEMRIQRHVRMHITVQSTLILYLSDIIEPQTRVKRVYILLQENSFMNFTKVLIYKVTIDHWN